jgi:hypothetical protein
MCSHCMDLELPVLLRAVDIGFLQLLQDQMGVGVSTARPLDMCHWSREPRWKDNEDFV